MMSFFAGEASPALEGITEDGSDPVPELLVVPPPPPRKVLPVPESLGPAPEKPERPPSVNLNEFSLLPPVEYNGVATIVTLTLCETKLKQPA